MEAGINCFDTAELYPVLPISKENQGESERIIGRWRKERGIKDEIMLFTKIVGPNNSTARDGSPITREAILSSLARSMENLQTDYVDLYQLHWPNRPHYHFRNYWDFNPDPSDTQRQVEGLEEIVATLDELQKAGKIGAYGVSNDTAWGVMKLLEISNAKGQIRLASAQQEYSILHRIYEPDLQEIGLREDVSLLTYSSLAGGLLTGKYGRKGETIPENSRRSIEPQVGGRVNDAIWDIMQKYLDLAANSGIDPVHFAYRFALSQAFVGSVIIGATDQSQLAHILDDDYQLLPEDVLEEIAKIRRQYPLPL